MSLRVVVTAVVLLCSVTASAQDSKRADALFREGRRLLRAGKLDEACARFAASNQAEASVGALLSLGECELRRDHPSAAWRALRRAELLARALGDGERAEFAANRMREVGEDLGFVTLEIADRWRGAGLTVSIDGRTLLDAEIDRPIPLDPGRHQLRAEAPGAAPLSRELSATAGATDSVAIELEPLAPRPVEPSPSDDGPGARTIAGISMTAAGGVAIAAAITTGAVARSQWNDVKGCRDRESPPCTLAEIDRGDAAQQKADIATGLFVTGALVAGAGLALWLTAEPDAQGSGDGVALSPVIGGDLVGLSASGSF